MRRAIAHVEGAVRRIPAADAGIAGAPADTRVRYRPVGTVGLVTPWNNPLAIPVGKIAPALAFGNAIVWKPACRAPRTALAILAALADAGVPADLVSLVFGDADTARCLIAHPAIDAVSVTGSTPTGRSAAALCAQHGKPLQAELGGNNAAIVLADCDVEAEARGLALAAFGFAGQRCTATRRIIVERAIAARFTEALVAAVQRLARRRSGGSEHAGRPARLPGASRGRGRLRSRRPSRRAAASCAAGGRRRGSSRAAISCPRWWRACDPRAPLVQEETFGPIAVILQAADLDDAIRIANDVPQGLVASVCTRRRGGSRALRAADRGGDPEARPGRAGRAPRRAVRRLEGVGHRPPRARRLGPGVLREAAGRLRGGDDPPGGSHVTPEQQETLTRVGPGNADGRAPAPLLAADRGQLGAAGGERPPVRLLGEDLVVFRSQAGELGVLEEHCPHRRASLRYGCVEADGIRCAYHGWKFSPAGRCLEIPMGPASTRGARARWRDGLPRGGARRPRLRLPGSRARAAAAALGPVRVGGRAARRRPRADSVQLAPDHGEQRRPAHLEWLHGHHLASVRRAQGLPEPRHYRKRQIKIGFDRFRYGIVKRRVVEGGSEQDDDWKIGHPLVFPVSLRVGADPQHRFQIRVPVDDTHTQHYWYSC